MQEYFNTNDLSLFSELQVYLILVYIKIITIANQINYVPNDGQIEISKRKMSRVLKLKVNPSHLFQKSKCSCCGEKKFKSHKYKKFNKLLLNGLKQTNIRFQSWMYATDERYRSEVTNALYLMYNI